MELGILILRLPYGLDFSSVLGEDAPEPTTDGCNPDAMEINTQMQDQVAEGLYVTSVMKNGQICRHIRAHHKSREYCIYYIAIIIYYLATNNNNTQIGGGFGSTAFGRTNTFGASVSDTLYLLHSSSFLMFMNHF